MLLSQPQFAASPVFPIVEKTEKTDGKTLSSFGFHGSSWIFLILLDSLGNLNFMLELTLVSSLLVVGLIPAYSPISTLFNFKFGRHRIQKRHFDFLRS